MDWCECSEVERIPGKVSGAWLVKGSRVQADAVVANAADGFTPEEIAYDLFEGLILAQVEAVLAFANRARGGRPSTELAAPKLPRSG